MNSLVFVDTSIWVEYFRGNNPHIRQKLDEYLENDRVALSIVSYFEILSGVKRKELSRIKRIFTALPLFYPSPETWNSLEQVTENLRDAGVQPTFPDLLIALITQENKGLLWTLDRDFKTYQKAGAVELL